jgi:hypothetical protein
MYTGIKKISKNLIFTVGGRSFDLKYGAKSLLPAKTTISI